MSTPSNARRDLWSDVTVGSKTYTPRMHASRLLHKETDPITQQCVRACLDAILASKIDILSAKTADDLFRRYVEENSTASQGCEPRCPSRSTKTGT